MKKIVIKLHPVFKYCSPHSSGIELMSLPDDAKISQVLELLGLNHGEVGLVLVNDEIVDENYCVPEGAIIKLYPVFGGG